MRLHVKITQLSLAFTSHPRRGQIFFFPVHDVMCPVALQGMVLLAVPRSSEPHVLPF